MLWIKCFGPVRIVGIAAEGIRGATGMGTINPRGSSPDVGGVHFSKETMKAVCLTAKIKGYL
jgi:hypothetical protein